MATFGKKTASEDEESDDMGSTKLLINKKPNAIKKRKRNNTKQEEEERDEENEITTALLDNNSIGLQEQEEHEKKKLKKEKKPKQKATPKKKAPLDLDRQCGVLIAPNNNPCTRSLTCKIHAMGAKRAVEGRSQPFNELLAAYQKKGIGRPHVPGIMNDKDGTIRSSTYALDSTSTTVNAKKHTSTLSLTKYSSNISNNGNVNNKQKINAEEEADIDSDEETENVRLAIEQSKPIPLGIKRLFYVKRKRKYCKLRDILLEAITPKDSSTSVANNNSNTNEVYTSIMNQSTF